VAFGDVVSSAKTATAGDTDASITFGFTATSGNLLVLCVSIDDGDAITTGVPTGYTLIHEIVNSVLSHHMWAKISDGTETASPTITYTSTEESATTIVEFEGPFAASPMPDAAEKAEFYQSSTSATIDTGDFTPDANGKLIVVSVGVQDGDSIPSAETAPESITDIEARPTTMTHVISERAGSNIGDVGIIVGKGVSSKSSVTDIRVDYNGTNGRGIAIGAAFEQGSGGAPAPVRRSLAMTGVGR